MNQMAAWIILVLGLSASALAEESPKPVSVVTSIWSRGNDDAPENTRGNYSTGTLYSTLKYDGVTGEVQLLALPYNHAVPRGASPSYCLREVSRWKQTGDAVSSLAKPGARKYLLGSPWKATDRDCVMLPYVDPKLFSQARNVYFQSLDVGRIQEDGVYGGEIWVEVAPKGQKGPVVESDLNVKHKLVWRLEIRDGKLVSSDIQMVNPDGQNKQITDTLRYQGTYSASGTHNQRLTFKAEPVKKLEPAFPAKPKGPANLATR